MVLEETDQVRHEARQVAFHRLADIAIEFDPDDGEENNIDKQEYANGHASPLKPNNPPHSSVDRFGRMRPDTGRERRKTGAVGLRRIVAKHVLQIHLDAVEEPRVHQRVKT